VVQPHGGGRRSPIWLEVIVILWLLWIYDAINNLAPLRIAMANHDASDILHVEKGLHLDPEAAMDKWLSGHHGVATLISNYYDNAHFGVTLALVGILWVKWPDLYRPLRNNLVMINVIGMAVFWLFPTAPPRLLNPAMYSDVVANTHAFGSWHTGTLATAANQLAAMPSLHIAWACWCSLAMWRLLNHRRFAVAVWVYPVITALAVLSTGNHWFLDVLAGVATFVLSAVIADRWQGWWTAREARKALEQSKHSASELTPR
jgi:membrane-associated phospholipid phosphatase